MEDRVFALFPEGPKIDKIRDFPSGTPERPCENLLNHKNLFGLILTYEGYFLSSSFE